MMFMGSPPAQVAVSRIQSLRERLTKSPWARQIAYAGAWSLYGAIVSRGLGLCVSIWLARTVGQHGFGEIGIIQNTTAMFGTLASFGLAITATKHVAEYRTKDRNRLGALVSFCSLTALVISGAAAAILSLLAPFLATRTLAAPQLEGVLRLSAFLIVLGGLSGTLNGILAGFEEFKKLFVVNAIAGVLLLPICFITVAVFGGVKGFVCALIATQALGCALSWRAIVKTLRPLGVQCEVVGALRESGVLVRYSLPATLTDLMVAPVNWVCAAMIVNQEHGYSHMGLLNAIIQWQAVLLFLPAALSQGVLPALSARLHNATVSTASRLVGSLFWLNAMISLPMVVIVCILSPLILSTYGKGFSEAWPAFITLQLGTLFQILQGPFIRYLQSKGMMWTHLLLNVSWGGLTVMLTYLLRERGALGYCLAQSAAFAVYTFPVAIVLKRQRMSLPWIGRMLVNRPV